MHEQHSPCEHEALEPRTHAGSKLVSPRSRTNPSDSRACPVHLDSAILRATALLELAGVWELARFCGLDLDHAEAGSIRLASEGLLERFWMPPAGDVPGQWLVCLTRRGARKGSALIGRSVHCLRIDDRASIFAHHRLAVSQVLASLVAGLGRERVQALLVGDALSEALRKARACSRYAPDAYLAFLVGSSGMTRVRHMLVEVDRGTEGRHQLRAKLHRLDRYYLEDHRRTIGSDRLLVAFTVPTLRREEVFMGVVREGLSRVRIVVAQHAEVVGRTSAAHGWRDAWTGKVCSLTDPY
jgi:hypothetical protein